MRVLGVLAACLVVAGCHEHVHHDPSLQMKVKDYENHLLSPHAPANTHKLRTEIAPRASVPAAFSHKVSLSATQDVPLKDLILELARQAGASVSVAPSVKGALSLHIQNKPFIDVLRQVCEGASLRYTQKGDTLLVEADAPFVQTHNIQFLTLVRENNSRISIATDVFSAIDGKQNELDNGSNTLLTGNSRADFWEDLKKNLMLILQEGGTGHVSPDAFSIHPQAGLLSVLGTKAQQDKIARYLLMLQKAASGQVLIEAKIVEVHLKDEFKSGINWQSLKGDFALQAPMGSVTTPGPFNPAAIPPRNVFTIGGHGRHLSGLISFMQHFGTVRTLSNPRMTVINNQAALLKVATNRVFFRINYDRDYSFENSSREREHVSSEIQTVPIGLVMVVQPSINLEDGSIIMTVRPTISRVVGEKPDPAVSIVSHERLTSFVPEIQVREMDSVFRLFSGEVILMGGLMEEHAGHGQDGVPEVSDIPILGNLFKGKEDNRFVSELVIFLRATILDAAPPALGQDSSLLAADTGVLDAFTHDPRPWDKLGG